MFLKKGSLRHSYHFLLFLKKIFISLGTSAQFFNLNLDLGLINSRDFSPGRTVIEAVLMICWQCVSVLWLITKSFSYWTICFPSNYLRVFFLVTFWTLKCWRAQTTIRSHCNFDSTCFTPVCKPSQVRVCVEKVAWLAVLEQPCWELSATGSFRNHLALFLRVWCTSRCSGLGFAPPNVCIDTSLHFVLSKHTYMYTDHTSVPDA